MIRVLVVEDEAAVMEITCKYVGSVEGFTVVGRAYDGDDAETLALQLAPDLIILDIYMPKKNGVDVLAELRAEGCSAEAIFLTAAADKAVRARAESLGIVDYLVKPFNLERFQASLTRVKCRARAEGWRASE